MRSPQPLQSYVVNAGDMASTRLLVPAPGIYNAIGMATCYAGVRLSQAGCSRGTATGRDVNARGVMYRGLS
jgi:hypothetical protein